jgi:hypothetical protein
MYVDRQLAATFRKQQISDPGGFPCRAPLGFRMAHEVNPCLIRFHNLESHWALMPDFQVIPPIGPGGFSGGAAFDDKPEEVADELSTESDEFPPIADWSPRMTRKP